MKKTGLNFILVIIIKIIFMRFFLIFIILFSLINQSLCSDYKPSSFVFPPFWATLGFHRVTQTEVSMFLKGFRISSPQGIAIVKLKSQDDPSTENDDDELTGYAVDSGIHLLAYNPTFTSTAVFGKKDRDLVKFNQPHGVDATPEGDVFIADTGNQRIVVLFNNNGKIHYVNSFYGFKQPYDLSHDFKRNIFITDNEADKIKIYRKNGKYIRTIKHSSIKKPTGIEVIDSKDIWHFYKEDFIVIIKTSSGSLLFTFM